MTRDEAEYQDQMNRINRQIREDAVGAICALAIGSSVAEILEVVNEGISEARQLMNGGK